MEYFTLIAIFITSILLILYVKLKNKYTYFKNLNVPFAKPIFLFGSSIKSVTLSETFEETFDRIYKQLQGHKVGGFYQFWAPAWMITDPDLIEKVLIKDFSHFQDHFDERDIENNPLDGNLFNLKGQEWKTIRAKLSPIFTSGKLKWMMSQIVDCGDNLIKTLEKSSTRDVEIKPILQKHGLNVIASCAFGINIETLNAPNSKFLEMANKILHPSKLRVFVTLTGVLLSNWFKALKFKTNPEEVTDFFIGLTKYSIEERLKNNIKRNDFIQLLAQLKEKGSIEYENEDINIQDDQKFEFTYEVLAAQVFIFFAAGLDTTSTLIMYTLYLFSTHPEIQEKVREEIEKNAKDDITYEGLQNMAYLDCCISETLRFFPPSPALIRQCTKDYTVDDITIPKEATVVIPIQSLHMNPDYFPDPHIYNPDRFLDSRYSLRQSYGVYLPFGDGPRVCIARRFALLSSKIAIVKIMQNYKLIRSNKNIEPLRRDPKSLTITPIGGLYVSLERI